jgi:hypothetical protein
MTAFCPKDTHHALTLSIVGAVDGGSVVVGKVVVGGIVEVVGGKVVLLLVAEEAALTGCSDLCRLATTNAPAATTRAAIDRIIKVRRRRGFVRRWAGEELDATGSSSTWSV